MSRIEKECKEQCNICCENKGVFICCPYCQTEACLLCQETYILDQVHPKCMSCKKEWTNIILRENFNRKFINEKYKKHKQDILFDIEKSLLPTDQKRASKVMDLFQKIDELNREKEKIKEKDKNNPKTRYMDDLYRIDCKIKEYDTQIHFIYEFIETGESKEENNVFRRVCLKKDCRGYFDDISWTCGLCDTKVCEDCLEINSDEHKCDKEIVKNVKSILKETKPCPKCSASIFKQSGCDQMYCVVCRTAFSWKTGKIETGPIHNPHYWEYLRHTGRDIEEVARRNGIRMVGNCITFNDLSNTLVINSRFNGIFPVIYHLENVELPKFRNNNLENENRDLRIKYLCKIITEKEFKSKLTTRWKKKCFKLEVYQIFDMFIQASKDILLNFFKKNIFDETGRSILSILEIDKLNTLNIYLELNELQKYTIENIKKIHDLFEYKYNNYNNYIDNEKLFSILLPTFNIRPHHIFKEAKKEEYKKRYNGYNWETDHADFFRLQFELLDQSEKDIYIQKYNEEKIQHKKLLSMFGK